MNGTWSRYNHHQMTAIMTQWFDCLQRVGKWWRGTRWRCQYRIKVEMNTATLTTVFRAILKQFYRSFYQPNFCLYFEFLYLIVVNLFSPFYSPYVHVLKGFAGENDKIPESSHGIFWSFFGFHLFYRKFSGKKTNFFFPKQKIII